jgi:hypothetical protein
MMVLGAIYAFLGTVAFNDWLLSYWTQQSSAGDPLQATLGPSRLGEAAAWGGPHVTIVDYASLQVPFRDAVQSILRSIHRPVVRRGRLGLHKGGMAAVLHFESPDLDACRRALETEIASLIVRTPIVDEEWQRARLWILNCGKGDPAENLRRLGVAKQAYDAAGRPGLQGAFPWRLNALVDYANRTDRKALDTLLTTGMWPHVGRPGGLHLTIASGLTPGEFDPATLEKHLGPQIERTVPAEFTLDRLAIMEPDPAHTVDVMYWDSLTRSLARDHRPGLRVAQEMFFAE